MSSTPPDYDEVEEGSPFGGAECDESSPEPQPPEDQEEENLYPFDNLAVEYYEDPIEASGSKEADGVDTVYDVNAANADSTDQILDENTDALHAFEPDVQVNEESYHADYNDLQKTYFEDFMYSNTSSFDEGSNSNFDDTREEPKGSPLGRFSKIVKAVEIAEYETLQVLYQLLYQRSAWDTQQILAQRILEFCGFNFSQKSEDYFNREMMLRTQPNEVLVKIGAILGLHQVQRMLFDMDSGRVDLISGIMYFLSRPNKKTHLGIKCEVVTENIIKTPQPKTPSKCGCRNRCFKKFSPAQRNRLLEYMKELDEKKLGDMYLISLMDCKKILREPNEHCRKLKEVTYNYKCKYGMKEAIVCKGAFITLHGVKLGRMNNLQLKLKSGVNLPIINVKDFPPIVSEEEAKLEASSVKKLEPSPSRKLLESNIGKKTWMSSEEQVRRLEKLTDSLKARNVLPNVLLEKCDLKKAMAEDKNQSNEDQNAERDGEQSTKEKVQLKDLPLVVAAIESSSEELLLDVHFLLFLNSADADKVKENILEFKGFTFESDTEEYDERIEFLQRMSAKIVSDVARSFSLEILSTKEATIKNILTFLTSPDESFLKITSSMPLSLSDVEFDDFDDMSDSDVSITCEVVEKKVECIDLLSSGEDSDREDKPRKEKKASPQKTAILKQALAATAKTPTTQPQKLQSPIIPPVTVSSTPAQFNTASTSGGQRSLRNFETICKIVNTHPHEYLIDIHELLYLRKHEPSTLRDDILNFGGFSFEKSAPEYVKRKQLLDRMLYNSVRRIYNTLIHNTTEVKVFSKPTMITEIFQFLFNLPPIDTSVRPHTSVAKPSLPVYSPGPVVKSITPSVVSVASPAASPLPLQSGKLSDLKRVFQRVACFPCEYLVDVHKLLFMTDCDAKVIRNNIFAFKGFTFSSYSQEFQQRKMYLEYLTFHSLRKISSVLTTRSVDLRNSTKHELATHLTQVLAEYCCDNQPETDGEAGGVVTEDANNQDTQSNVTSSSIAIENIVVTPIIDPSYARQNATEIDSLPRADLQRANRIEDPQSILPNSYGAIESIFRSSDSHKRPLTTAERQRLFRERKKAERTSGVLDVPSQKVALTNVERQRRFRERKKAEHATAVLDAPSTLSAAVVPRLYTEEGVQNDIVDRSSSEEQEIIINEDPHCEMEVYNPSSTENSVFKPSAPNLAISIVDARSINSPSVSTTTNSRGRRKRAPVKVQTQPDPLQQIYSQNLNTYSPNVPSITGTTTNTPGAVSQPFQKTVNIPIVNSYTQPITTQILGLSQNLGPTVVTQVPSKNTEIIVPGECIINESEDIPPSKKPKLNSPKDSKSINNKIREAINSDDEDCDKPLSSLVGHPIDSVLKKHIVDIVEESNLGSITINGVIQKIFAMYPKFDLSYRKEFIKSTLRSMLYRLGDQKKSGVAGKRETNSPDCSVTTTEDCDSALEESPASAMECS